MKKSFVYLFVLFTLVLASCQAATPTAAPTAADNGSSEQPTEAAPAATEPVATGEEPEVCATDEWGCAKIPAGQTIKLGMGAPMTGDYASFGVDISQGALLAIKDAEPVDGFVFELVAQDTQGTPEGGASVANKLASDPTVVAIPGHIFSGSTEAAMPIYEKAGLPMLSPSATNPPLTQQGSKVFNRIAFTDSVQGKFAADYLFTNLGFTKIAVMHDGGAYGQGLADVVREEFTALGGEVVAYEGITPGEVDYSATLSAVAAMKPEAVYFGGYVAEGVVLTNQMKQSGLADAIFFGCDGTFGAEFIDKTGANGEGTYAASLVPPVSDAKTAFDEAYQTAYGVPTGSLSPYTWSGYDVAAALIAQVRSVAVLGGDGNLYVPRGALVSAVRNMKGYQGLTGDVTCDATGECNTAGPTFYVVSNGEWVEAK